MIKKQHLTIITVTIVIIAIIVAGFQFGLFNFGAEKEEKETMQPTTAPFLWRIEGETPSYLYGSIHVATEEIVTLPNVVMAALTRSDALYTEIKLDFDTQYDAALFSAFNTDKLEDILPDELAKDLDSYLKTKETSLEQLNSFKPWFIAIYLIQLEYPQYFSESEYPGGLDQYIWDLAVSMGKETYGLETPYEQLGVFDDLNESEEIQLLSDSLDDVVANSTYGDPFIGLIDAYLESDLETYLELEYQDYEESDPLYAKLMTRLLTVRNIKMAERISENITKNSDKRFFFTIGSAHFHGEDNIITLLEEKGYTVTPVEFDKCSTCGCNEGELKINDRCYYPYSPP